MKYLIFFICISCLSSITNAQSTHSVPRLGQLRITELMVDPIPSAGVLPEEEYVEIFNTTADTLELLATALQVGNSITYLPAYSLPPQSYLLLVGPQSADYFNVEIPILSLSKWPRLTNSGQLVQLINSKGEWLEFFAYSDRWYQDPSKKNGGFSLEKIHPQLTADCANSWKAHPTLIGGSPGIENPIDSASVDRTPPFLLNLSLPDNFTLTVGFDEKVEAINSVNVLNEENQENWPIAAIEISENSEQIHLLFSEGIPLGLPMQLTLEGVSDCSGNVLMDTMVAFAFGKIPMYHDLVISEILFDPYPGQPTYLEVFNRSNQILELGSLNLVKNESARFYPLPQKWLYPQNYYVLTKDTSLLHSTYPWLTPEQMIPVSYAEFRQSGETISLQNQDSIIDRLTYHPDWHHPLLGDTEGVALERLSNKGPTQESSNWHSAAASVGYATPGLPNSYQLNDEPLDTEDWIVLEREVIQQGQDLLIQYRTPFAGCLLTIYVFDMSGAPIGTPINQLQVQTQGWVKWSGTDDFGRSLNPGIYILSAQLVHPDGFVQTSKKVMGIKN